MNVEPVKVACAADGLLFVSRWVWQVLRGGSAEEGEDEKAKADKLKNVADASAQYMASVKLQVRARVAMPKCARLDFICHEMDAFAVNTKIGPLPAQCQKLCRVPTCVVRCSRVPQGGPGMTWKKTRRYASRSRSV